MFVDGGWFWSLGETERDEAYILTDTACLLCGDSLEGQSFVQWYFHGPQLELAGMHVQCASTMCMGMLKDLATGGALEPEALQRMLSGYQARPHQTHQTHQTHRT